jgi:drug/metabolite transporter (DMT)-like permease
MVRPTPVSARTADTPVRGALPTLFDFMNLSPRTLAVLALVAASFLFGATFVVVKSAVEDIGPIMFVGWRFLLGAVVLLAISFPRGSAIWRDGSLAGLALFGGYVLQTSGLTLTSASNSALITGLFVIFTPFLAALVNRYRPSPWTVGSALVAFVGLYLVTGTDQLSLGRGDLLTVGCALAFAFHVVALSRFAPRHPVIPFTAVQIAIVAVLAIPLGAITEGITTPPRSVWGAIIITGIGVSVGAYILQVWAQRVVGPGTAAVILAAEPAFGVATAWVVLGERLDLAGWVGSLLILAAMYVVITRQRDPGSVVAEAVSPAH